ncbi:cytochrome P450 [Cyathus striatus]|nr:cytochrome P450 [Cyathus striatus]
MSMSICLSWYPAWLTTLLAVAVFSMTQKIANGKHAVDKLPGLTTAFAPFTLPGVLLPTTWWNPGIEFVWRWKSFLYKQYNADTFSIVPFLIGSPTVVTSNIDVARQVLGNSNKTTFGRAELDEGALGYWGINLFSAQGDTWRKHRRIVGPAFSQELYELVWNESLHLYSEMLAAEGFEDKKVVEIPKIQRITFDFAFLVIGRCGFGFPFSWTEQIESNRSGMSFPDAMHIFVKYMQILQLPKMIRRLPISRFKQLNASITVLKRFMERKIVEKEDNIKMNGEELNREDIFSSLIEANHAEADAKLKLDDSELISNVFLMLVAGHETTAHTLAATMACLARYQEQQQEIFEEVNSVIGNDRNPMFEDFHKLNKVQACFYEALRMFPAGFASIREAKVDSVLTIPKPLGHESTTIAIIVDMVGLHRDPRVFKDPEEYRPSRWYGDSNESETLAIFGLGQRSCIGRKFAVTESVCLIAMFLRDWKIEPLTKPGESVEQWFDKVSQARVVLTLAVGDVGLRFVRRA